MNQCETAPHPPESGQELSEILRLVDDFAADGLLVTDPQGVFIHANAAFRSKTGLDAIERSSERRTVQLADMPDSGAMPDAPAGTRERQVVVRYGDGTEYRTAVTTTPVHDTAGVLRYIVATIGQRRSAPIPEPAPGGIDFMRCLIDALEAADASRHGVVVFAIEIDEWAVLEQRIGEAALAAQIEPLILGIRKTLRQTDHLLYQGKGRLLVLVCPHQATEEPTIQEISERLLVVIRTPFELPAGPSRMTASIGTARHPQDGNTATALIEQAVSALRHAQQQGGNIASYAEPHRAVPAFGEHGKLRNDLLFAISRNEMVLHYQPQTNLRSGEIVGLEALIRWQHPEHGLMLPGQFLVLAEQSTHIVRIGNWVIHETCRQLEAWRRAGIPLVKIAINLSTQHFLEENLPATIQRALDDHCVNPRHLEIEITEGAMMQDFALATQSLQQLKNIGIRISLDDFGTGYSSMSYLSRLPIDVVKIDQSFVRDITTNPVNATIARATIAMSHQLGKRVLAEGVETEEQMQYLRKNDCDEMQGYFFSTPRPADQIATMLREDRRLDQNLFADSAERGAVLVVDDEANILSALKRVLRQQGYTLFTADSAAEGLSLLARHAIQVVITDHQMPAMSGTEFLARVKALHPRTVRMLLTGNSDISTVTDAINKGAAYRFMLKPWQDDVLRYEIAAALRYWRELYDHEPRAHTN